MKNNDNLHPEITEIEHICAVSPDDEGTKEICDLIKTTSIVTDSKNKKKSSQKESQLDNELKDTFPASDPVTHY